MVNTVNLKIKKQNNQAVTGSLGFTWKADNDYKVSLLANTGFRSPNVDDMTKVFESPLGRNQFLFGASMHVYMMK